MKKIDYVLITLGLAALVLAASCSQANRKADAGDSAVIENIMTRTSVRQFTSRPIAKDTLEMIVRAGMAAPSAMNKQPWLF